ncbi:MAG: glycosyltransferase family 4 protein [Deltaproteobacteria bacterium]|nr:glycosyltransferase family 4 protein [Deltaproteobacteria bacterium]
MKILMVISQFHPIIGGTERQAKLLAQTLRGKGVKVSILTGCWRFGTAHYEEIDGIPIFRNFACWGMFGIKGVRTLSGLIYMFTLGLYLFMHRREYDIIHVHQALYPAFVSVFVGKQILGKPVLVKTASSGETSDINGLKRFPLGSFQLKYLLKEMELLVAVSKVSAKEFEQLRFPKERIVNIPNGVEVPKEDRTSYDQVIHAITTARLSREKGVDILLKAWKNVFKEEKTLKLAIIGSGPLEEEMKKMTQSLNIGESVEFVGFVSNVDTYLKNADMFILASRTEGMSNALLEAMSYGFPCIATNVGGNGELLGGEDKEIPLGEYVIARNGLLVNPDDVKGLSEAILYLVRHKEERAELGRRSRTFIKENYSIDSIAGRYISLYQFMLNKRS